VEMKKGKAWWYHKGGKKTQIDEGQTTQ
jgi:hypothetical protein